MSEKCLKNIDKYCMMYNVMTYTFYWKDNCITYGMTSVQGASGALCIFLYSYYIYSNLFQI